MDALKTLLAFHQAQIRLERAWKCLDHTGSNLRFHSAAVLKLIADHPGIRPIEVRNRTGLHQTQLERLQGTLVKGGFVRKTNVNRALATFELTPRGRELLAAFEATSAELHENFFGDMDKGELAAMRRGLAQLLERTP